MFYLQVNPMQVNLNLDEALIKEALQLTKLTTQEELLNLALRELVKSRRKKNLLDCSSTISPALSFSAFRKDNRV